MNSAENLIHSETMTHGGDILRDEVASMFADDGDAQDLIFTRHSQHLNYTMGLVIGNGAIQIFDAICRHFIRDILGFCFLFIDSHARDLRVGKRRPGDHRVIHLEFFEASEQGIDSAKPGLMRGDMGVLIGAGDIAAGINIWESGLQIFIDLYSA